ncbi:hypothetical protein AABE10_35515, partial [Paraburkholderia diazotrophica]
YAVHFVETDRKVGMRAKELCTLDHLPEDVLACLGERAKALRSHFTPCRRIGGEYTSLLWTTSTTMADIPTGAKVSVS